jgi:CSLREA domain-containing protein
VSRVGSRLVAVLIAGAALPASAAAATIQVTTPTDELGTGGGCSLREAVAAANSNTAVGGCPAGGPSDVVRTPAGIFQLTIAGAGEDANATGDLDATGTLTIRGAGAGRTVIDAGGIDRALDVGASATVTVDGVTVTGGRTPDGAPGTTGVDIDGHPSAPGGGIRSAGTLTVTNSEVVGNRTGDGGHGGIGSGTAGVANGGPGGSGIGGDGGASGSGGGIFASGPLTVEASRVAANSTGSGGDGAVGTGGQGGAGGDGAVPGGLGGPGHGGDAGDAGDGGGIAALAHATVTRGRIVDNETGAGGAGGAGIGGAGGAGGPVEGNGGAGAAGTGGRGGVAGTGAGLLATAGLTLEDSTLARNHGGPGGLGGLGAGGDGGAAQSGNTPGGAGGEGTAGRGGLGGAGGGLFASGTATIARDTFDANTGGDGGGSAGALGGDGGAAAGNGAGGPGGDAAAEDGAPGGAGANVYLTPLGPETGAMENTTVSGGIAGDGSPPGPASGGDGGPGQGTGDGGAGGDVLGDSAGGGGIAGGVRVSVGPSTASLSHVTIASNHAGAGAGLGTAAAGDGGAAGGGGGSSPGAAGTVTPGMPGSSPTAGGLAKGAGGTATLARSIVAANLPDNCTPGLFTDGGHNVTFPTATCPGTVADPMLGPLQDNGGPTETRRLGAGSPAIDLVPAASCPDTDQRGVARPHGPACDAGSYEVAAPGVTAGPAGARTQRSAVVPGRVNPNALPTSFRVIYGKTQAYGRQTLDSDAGAGTNDVVVLVALRGLSPATTYHFRLVATNADGTSMSPDATFRTRPVDRTPPVLSGLIAEPRVFRRGGRGTTFFYFLSEPARVTFRFAKTHRGRRVGGRCRRQTRANRSRPRCTRVRPLGGFTQTARAGANDRHFPGRLNGRRLGTGWYRVTLTAVDAGQNASAPKRARFRITRR